MPIMLARVVIAMMLASLVLVACLTSFMAARDSCAQDEKEEDSSANTGKGVADDILERMENVDKKVAGMKYINDKIEQLSKITYDLSRNTGAASEKKLKMDVQ